MSQTRPEDFSDPEAQTLRSEEQHVLWRAHQRLSHDDQEVLRLALWPLASSSEVRRNALATHELDPERSRMFIEQAPEYLALYEEWVAGQAG